jgi:hypothetical protein
MAKILNYLNALDQNAIVNEMHNENPVRAMTDFGLCKEEQAIFLSGDKEKIAEHIGIVINEFSFHAPILNISTF